MLFVHVRDAIFACGHFRTQKARNSIFWLQYGSCIQIFRQTRGGSIPAFEGYELTGFLCVNLSRYKSRFILIIIIEMMFI